jgi:hypothetical protein
MQPGSGDTPTSDVDDYLLHMRHHLDQILRRSPVMQYPPG